MTDARHQPKAGTERVTPQKVRAVLRKAGYTHMSSWVRSDVLGNNTIQIRHSSHSPSIKNNDPRMTRYYFLAAALIAAGITCEVHDGAVWVPMENNAQ